MTQKVPGDLLVESQVVLLQRVDAGQINNLNYLTIEGHGAGLLLDGHTRPVTHLLVRAREVIKERGLATVGITQQGNGIGTRAARGHLQQLDRNQCGFLLANTQQG